MDVNIKYVLFDLDGTLTDSSQGIIHSIFYVLDKYNCAKPSFNDAKKFIGPPLKHTFKQFLPNVCPSEAVKVYREYYATKGIYENALYPNVENILHQLKINQYHIALATAKPTYFAKIVLDYFNLSGYFDCIVGSHLDGNRTDKKLVIHEVYDQLGKPNPYSCLMIGDRSSDIEGGKHFGMFTAGVRYGYAKKEELEFVKPNYLWDSLEELNQLLPNNQHAQ